MDELVELNAAKPRKALDGLSMVFCIDFFGNLIGESVDTVSLEALVKMLALLSDDFGNVCSLERELLRDTSSFAFLVLDDEDFEDARLHGFREKVDKESETVRGTLSRLDFVLGAVDDELLGVVLTMEVLMCRSDVPFTLCIQALGPATSDCLLELGFGSLDDIVFSGRVGCGGCCDNSDT